MGCGYALSRGVRPGMTVAQATALLDAAVLARPFEPEQDAAALQVLARWCLRFTPRVMAVARHSSVAGRHTSGFASTCGDQLVLDMTGCDRLYGGRHHMAEAVVAGLRRLRLNLRAALSVTRAGAAALAQADPSQVCVALSKQELWYRLDRLQVYALNLEPSEVEGLSEVGIDRIEQLRRVPRDEVVARFGAAVLRRLDLAWGDCPCEDIEPVRRWEPPEVELRFAGPTTQFEAVQEAARQLCERLVQRLRHRLRSAASLTLQVERLDETLRAELLNQTVTLSRPSREAKHLWAMLRPHVERLHLGHGIEALTLKAKHAPRIGHIQLGSHNEKETGSAMAAAEAELVDVLSARLGPHRVTRPKAVATHVPESTVRWTPAVETPAHPSAPDLSDPAWGGDEDRLEVDRFQESVPVSGLRSVVGERPTWLFDPIESASVVMMSPEGPVMSLEWRGESHVLISSFGPERIAPRWWKSSATRVVVQASPTTLSTETNSTPPQPRPRHRKVDVLHQAEQSNSHAAQETQETEPVPPLWADLAARDYYRVQAESGLWLWIFRRLDTGRWFVHGLWV